MKLRFAAINPRFMYNSSSNNLRCNSVWGFSPIHGITLKISSLIFKRRKWRLMVLERETRSSQKWENYSRRLGVMMLNGIELTILIKGNLWHTASLYYILFSLTLALILSTTRRAAYAKSWFCTWRQNSNFTSKTYTFYTTSLPFITVYSHILQLFQGQNW